MIFILKPDLPIRLFVQKKKNRLNFNTLFLPACVYINRIIPSYYTRFVFICFLVHYNPFSWH